MYKKMLLASVAALCLWHAPTVEAETNTPSVITHSVEQQPLADIANHSAETAIAALYQAGIVHGDDTGAFRPDSPISRAEMVKLMLAAKRIEPVASATAHFADVPKDAWMFPYIETAYRLGLIEGESKGGKLYFKPNDQIKLQDFIPVLLQAKGKSGDVNKLLWSTTIKTLITHDSLSTIKEANQRAIVYALQTKVLPAVQLSAANQPLTRAEAVSYTYQNLYKATKLQAGKQISDTIQTPYKNVLSVQTTAYHETEIKSYLELPLRVGVVAVDPNVIPLGSHLYIEGYGYAVAGDIGSAVKNKHVDVFLPSLEAAMAYGRQKDTKVYILD